MGAVPAASQWFELSLPAWHIVATLFVTNRAPSYLRVRSAPARRILEGQPAIIGREGAWLGEAMRREGVDLDEAQMALREHGLASVEEAELVVLEVDGTISVVPRDTKAVTRGRRRVRYVRHG